MSNPEPINCHNAAQVTQGYWKILIDSSRFVEHPKKLLTLGMAIQDLSLEGWQGECQNNRKEYEPS